MSVKTRLVFCSGFVMLIATVGCGSKATSSAPLVGTWTAVEVTEPGKTLAPGATYKASIKFDAEYCEHMMVAEGEPKPRAWPVLKGKYTVDSSKSPAHIDFVQEGDGSQVRLGIFEFEGARLKLCLGGIGQPRPASLLGVKEGEILFVFEKKN